MIISRVRLEITENRGWGQRSISVIAHHPKTKRCVSVTKFSKNKLRKITAADFINKVQTDVFKRL